MLGTSELVRTAFENGALSFHTNDRPTNTTKYVYQERKHIGFADMNSTTFGLRNILQTDINTYLTEKNRTNNTLDKLKYKLLRCKHEDLNPDIYFKEFLSNFYTVLVSLDRDIFIFS